MELPTFQALYDAGKAEIQARNPALTDWNEGSRLDAVTGAGAALADELAEVIVRHFASQYVNTAVGAELDALAADRFGLTRLPATYPVGTVTWAKTPDVEDLAYVIPAGRTFSGTTSDGTSITVVSTGEASVGAADLEVVIPCRGTVLGRSQNCVANTIDTIDQPLGADPTASLSFATKFVGGDVAEADTDFRDRIRRYFQTLRRGTVAALEAGARQVPGVRFVTVDESFVASSGIVYVYVGDPDAKSNDAFRDLVAVELEAWRPVGVLVEVLGADREFLDVVLELTIRPGADQAAIANGVRGAIRAFTNTLNPNQTLHLSRLVQLAHNAHASIVAATISTPTADVAPAERQNAIRVLPHAITITFAEAT